MTMGGSNSVNSSREGPTPGEQGWQKKQSQEGSSLQVGRERMFERSISHNKGKSYTPVDLSSHIKIFEIFIFGGGHIYTFYV